MNEVKTIDLGEISGLSQEFGISCDKIYEALLNNDEIILGDASKEFYSVRRTPTLQEEKDNLDKSQMIISQDENSECNFKIFFTKKKEDKKD